jgi:molybdate-binding protein/DNA-binding XRE family transcriptional regulator
LPDTHRHPDDRLRLTRLARGHSQGDLARAAGITRQAISGIESGRWSPSLDVALSLAHALETTVEDLFGEAVEAPPVVGRLAVRSARPSSADATRRVLLSEVAGEIVAFPLSQDASLVPGFVPAIGVVNDPQQTDAQFAPAAENAGGDAKASPERAGGAQQYRNRHGFLEAVRVAEPGPTLAIAGCDPALALLQGPLQRHKPSVGLVWWPCGNALAVELLESGAVHAAATHRGVDTHMKHRPGVEAVGFASWREGLAVSPRQRDRVKNLEDVVANGLRIANREPGSEARRLLDEELARLGIDPGRVVGYETECTAHLLTASAIRSGLADAAVTTEPSALAYGLDFLPWREEMSELHIPRSLMGSVEVRALLDVLGGRELRKQLAALKGYDAEPCGRILAA